MRARARNCWAGIAQLRHGDENDLSVRTERIVEHLAAILDGEPDIAMLLVNRLEQLLGEAKAKMANAVSGDELVGHEVIYLDGATVRRGVVEFYDSLHDDYGIARSGCTEAVRTYVQIDRVSTCAIVRLV